MLKSSLGCFVLALDVAATSLLWAGVANWFVLIPAISLALVALAAYLNFGPKGKADEREDQP
jgi:hypothetical protein